MAVDVLMGMQTGDEGKGRVADFLAPNYEIVARGNGGANAGHTFMPEGSSEPFVTNLLPSGIAHKGILNVLAQGIYLDADKLKQEITEGQDKGYDISRKNLLVSNIAHLVMPHHILLDKAREDAENGNGSTRRGIAFVAEEKYLREGVRVEDILEDNLEDNRTRAYDSLRSARDDLDEIIEEGEFQALSEMRMTSKDLARTKDMTDQANADSWASAVEFLKEGGYFTDTRQLLHDRLQDGQNILAEGAQAHWLDINHGQYPYVTSAHTTALGLLDGLGVGPKQLRTTMGVAKLINSRVGEGPFLTEIEDEDIASIIRGKQGEVDSEFGATTGRKRRLGYLDMVQINTAAVLNDVDEMIFNKLDHFPRYGEKVGVATAYRYGGKHLTMAPSSVREIAKARPVYDIFDAWGEGEISWQKNYNQLPENAKNLINQLEQYLGRIVSMVGVGPGHNQLLKKPKS